MSGVQRAMLEIVDQLDRSKFEIHVVCKEEGDLTNELARRGIVFHCIDAIDRNLRPGRDFRAYRALRALFEKYQFDLVHTHSSKPGIIGRLAARHAGVPAIIHQVHAFAFHEFSSILKKHVYSRIERWASQYCDHLLFVNHEEREMVLRESWLPQEQCTTIYNGVDIAGLNPRNAGPARQRFRETHQFLANEIIILFNGRLAYPKQPLLLADIAAQLQKQRPEAAWRFLVVGSGEEEKALRARVELLGLKTRVTMAGWHDDPRPSLYAADIALQTSLAEGLPLALIEAHAAGLPSVASNAKGNREVVTPETGFLCSPKDPAAYAAHLATLIDNKFMRAQMGRAARKRAELHFDTVTNNQRIVAIYEELLAEKGIRVRPATVTDVPVPERRAA
jgi:glycosyltransferase involved in cell wall biosynthesis